MKRQNINKFLNRLALVFLIHFIFKAGDHTFGNFFDFTFRGIVFSSFFIIYWLCTWYIAAYFHHKIQKYQKPSLNNTYLLFAFHFVYGFMMSFLTNYLYRLGDISLFDMGEQWSIVPLINPELTFSLFMIYMMIFSFDTYYHSIIKRKEDQLQLEKLKQENTLAQYLNLKSQIEPHFLFNSLSVLSSVIHTDANLASELILRLSRVLRYTIEKNKFTLVPLKEEIIFVENYLFLIQTRFIEGIIFDNQIDKSIIDTSYVPPVSLQLLIENAIKHNKFTAETPLRIQLFNDEDWITVKNNINIRNDIENSTNQGLDNLSGRYSHFSDKTVVIKKSDIDFTVSLPILTKSHYERFNI